MLTTKFSDFDSLYGIDGDWNVAMVIIVANLIGGCIFFWVNKWIFGDKKQESIKKDTDISIVLPATDEIVVE